MAMADIDLADHDLILLLDLITILLGNPESNVLLLDNE
jgi:hypothetical protein